MIETGLILGIESSCDETAAAVVRSGSEALSNVVASQMDLHANYGGVVPELASREHLRNIVPVVRAAITKAGITFADLDAIAVTEGPGLAGALLVGITYAKALAYGLNKPLIGVNHLEGHIHAVLMEATNPGAPSQTASPSEVGLPLLALVVSGGHTHLYLARQASKDRSREAAWTYQNVGRTVDDAAGEAYDKVAKLLGLGYPGGPWIDALAPHGNPRAVPFTFAQIKPRAQKLEQASSHSHKSPGAPFMTASSSWVGMNEARTFDFSFSGIKTAVLRYTQTHNMHSAIESRRTALSASKPNQQGIAQALTLLNPQTLDLIASFQHAVVGNLLRQSFAAAEAYGARGILVSGGVAANSELRRRFQSEASRRGLPIAFPSFALSTDNAAMIAAAAWPKFLAHDFAPEDLTATPQLRLG